MLRVLASLFLALALMPSCGSAQVVCTPQNAGFGDATTLTKTTVLDVDRTSGTCRPRVELYKTQEDLQRLYVELELGDPPPVDFARDMVVVRESTGERGLRWVVVRNDVVTAGTQGCTGEVASRCLVEIFSVSIRTPARGEEHACAAISCNAVSSDPAGGD